MTIAIPMVFAVLVCGFYLKVATPLFTARAQIIIDPRVQEQWNSQTGNAVLALDTAQVESQIAVLRSERIAKAVIAELNLGEDPDFQPRPGIMRRMLARIWKPQPIQMSPEAKERFIIESFAGNLDVRRSGLSYAIDISFSSTNPERAAEVANATAESYIRHQLAARSETARVGGDWLEARTLELRTQMSAAMRAVQEFKARRDYRIARPSEGTGAPAASPGNPDAAPADGGKPPATLEELETTAQIYQRVYESFLQGFTEAVQRQSFPVADARVLTSATAPFSKTEPRGTMVLALGLLISALFGTGVGLLRHQLDHTIRSPRQIRSELGLEYLGSLPGSMPSPTSALRSWLKRLRTKARRRTQAALPATLSATTQTAPAAGLLPLPGRRAREALIEIRERVDICMRPAERFTLGITSHREGEGKTVLACHLAGMFAMSGRRTLLIDANTTNPTLTRATDSTDRPGLLEVMKGHARLADALENLPGSGVDVLPLGHSTRPAAFHQENATALRAVLAGVMKDYDVVLVDLPPMTPSHGGLALYVCLDALLLVVESGRITRNVLEEDMHWLQTLQARLLGAVITKAGQ
ncbi:AAA family ATPase [Ancylobacter sp. 6x-1]|uniref:non-specific protein-tyrosine kinase n=2 Tax=Ancylobacter crimeensis TaxID=2579147 RepID=A0ABT0DBI1_9HYPH|nr:AAA family ATPase [Ancylobacter crimeensis]